MERRAEITKVQELVHELKVGDVMSRTLITVEPKALVKDLREILRVNRISGLPVVQDGSLVGIISLEDFIRALADKNADCTIEERMTRSVETLYQDEPLTSAIDKFDLSGVGRFPVVDRDSGRLVGIVTKGDVIKGLLRKFEVEYHEEEIHRYRASHIFDDIEADSTTLVFRYEVVGKDFGRAGESSSRLKRTLNRLGVRPDIVRRLAIASYEAEMNLVIYTEGGRITVQAEPGKVLVDVEDSGPGIADVEEAMRPGFSTASDWVRKLGFGAGMGLPNIKRMSDRFNIASRVGRGTRLRMSFYTGRNGHESS